MVVKETFQLLHLGLLEHRSLLWTQCPLIHCALVLLELLLFGELLVLSLLFCTCELLVSTVHSKFSASIAVELEDGCSSPSVFNSRGRTAIIAAVSGQTALASTLVNQCHPHTVQLVRTDRAIFGKMFKM